MWAYAQTWVSAGFVVCGGAAGLGSGSLSIWKSLSCAFILSKSPELPMLSPCR